MPLSHHFHIQYSVIIEINVSIFFLAQQGFLENVGKLSLFSFLPIELLIQVFSFLLFLMFNLWKLAVKKEEHKEKKVGSKNFAKLRFNGELQQVLEKQDWFFPAVWTGQGHDLGYFIPSHVSLGDGGVVPDKLFNECFAFKKFIAVGTVNL